MQTNSDEKFDAESFMERVESLILMDGITDDQKIEILQKLLATIQEE
jgi:hypothetical protein